MKHIIGLLAMLLPILSAAQSPPVKPLNIGDTVPDVTITNVYNYPSSTIRLSDLKGKLVVLDFWATWCGSCISTFPKMQALKKEFGNKLQVFFVNNDKKDNEKKVSGFLKKRETRTGEKFTLPYVLEDSVLNHFFPHQTIPHCIWLDSSLRVIAITEHREVTSINIHRYLSKEALSLPYKNDETLFNRNLPFLVNGNGGEADDFIYRSIITDYKESLGMSAGQDQRDDGKVTRMYIMNYPLYSIFQIAYPGILKYNTKRTFIESTDSLLFIRTKDHDRARQHLFCYELTTSPVTQDKIKVYLQNDLERVFHAVARNELRLVDCYVLTTNNYISESITKGGPSEKDIDEQSLRKHFTNISVAEAIPFLEGLLDRPIVDESRFKKNIDIIFPRNIYDYTPRQIISYLNTGGITLSKTKRILEVGVIIQSNN